MATIVKHMSSYWTESFEDWRDTFHPSLLRPREALIDPGREAFQTGCQIARLKTERKGTPWGCVLAVFVQSVMGTDSNVFVGKTRAGRYYLRLTWNGRRIQRFLTDEETKVALKFDEDYNLPPRVVRVKIDLNDGTWRYAPGKPGAHDGGKDREGRERTGGTTCEPRGTQHPGGPSAKLIRDRMRRQLVKDAAIEQQELALGIMEHTERKFSG